MFSLKTWAHRDLQSLQNKTCLRSQETADSIQTGTEEQLSPELSSPVQRHAESELCRCPSSSSTAETACSSTHTTAIILQTMLTASLVLSVIWVALTHTPAPASHPLSVFSTPAMPSGTLILTLLVKHRSHSSFCVSDLLSIISLFSFLFFL